ncbi:MAG: DNA modification methylase [Phycisphaerae bacterium]
MQIELRPIDQIKPYPGNPRNNDDAVDAVAKSLKEYGFRQPIVVDTEGIIIVGHTRYKAAVKLGLAQVPVHVATDLTPAQVKAYRIADNATAEIADWNYELLPIELSGLEEMNYDLGMLGFDQEELKRIMSGDVQEGLTDPDDVPLPPDAATTQPGDLWILGNHRLLCGDSSKPEDLDRLLDGQRIHLVNTDPPYNVKVEPRSNNAIAAGLSSFTAPKHRAIDASDARGMHHQGFDLARDKTKAKGTTKQMRAKDRPLANDFVTDEAFDGMLDAWFGNMARVLEEGRGFYIWGGYANLGNYPPFLKKHGLYFSQGIVWDKQHPVLTRKDYLGAFEICFYGWNEGAAHKYYGPNNATDLWHVKKVNPQSMVHLTEKPVELAVRALQYSSLAGENVLDLFGGSGSTLIAAEQTGRRSYLMELDTLYCDVIVQRWEKFTGKKAQRIAADGRDGTAMPEKTPAVAAGVEEG